MPIAEQYVYSSSRDSTQPDPTKELDPPARYVGGHHPLRRTILKACGMLVAANSALSAVSCTAERRIKWLAFYGQTADENVLASYDVVVLDPAFGGSVATVAKAGARVCAYLSLGEIRSTDPIYAFVDRAALVGENPAWPGTFRVDVRHRSWQTLILDHAISEIHHSKHFAGLLLDTLDTPPYLEQRDPLTYRGMGQAAADLVWSIRKRYPNLLILVNRGYALLPGLAEIIDGVVAESMLTVYAADGNNAYKWNEASDVSLQISLLAPTRDRRVPVLSLDYWDPQDAETIKRIYARQRRMGFHPYVATQMLDQVVPEPA